LDLYRNPRQFCEISPIWGMRPINAWSRVARVHWSPQNQFRRHGMESYALRRRAKALVSTNRRRLIGTLAALAALGAVLLAAPSANAQTIFSTVLQSFVGAEGASPTAGLVRDGSGNLFGTTQSGGANGFGTVFELVNSSGTYSEKVLYSFTNSAGDGAIPVAGLILDGSGNLFGTTYRGGTNNSGTVFELVNSSGTYSERVLYSFTNSGGDGTFPFAGLIMDTSGNLFGTTGQGGTNNSGTVFELVNSSGTYSERVLYSFTNSGGDGAIPTGGLIMDASGNLFGTTEQGGTNNSGTVFELVNSSGTYSERVLYSFRNSGGDGAFPFAGLILDASGNLFGTTELGGGAKNAGTVFELVNSSGMYSERVLHSFTNSGGDGAIPTGGLIMDASGNVFGTTEQGGGAKNAGTVFELVNSSGTYSETVLHSFGTSVGCGTDGQSSNASLILDASGNLFGTTTGGGANGAGTVFEIGVYSGPAVATVTSLTSSLNPAGAGDPVMFVAKVTSSLAFPPTGTVAFFNGSVQIGSATLACGTATTVVEDALTLGIGVSDITAQYTPDVPAFNSSGEGMSQTVNEAGVVLTSGNNTLTGNQTINGGVSAGSVTANTFAGNGAGLTGVVAAGLNCTGCVGPGQLGVPWAAGDFASGNALNALMLGGKSASAFQPAGSYATTGANLFSGDQNIAGGLTLTGALSGASANFTGNIGLGVPSPISRISIASARNDGVRLSGNSPGIFFHRGPESDAGTQRGGLGLSFGSDDYGANTQPDDLNLFAQRGNINLNTATSLVNPIIRMTVTAGGNVGIGTASPQATLEVNGTAQFDSTVTFAPGQTFPGAGAISGVTAGTGLLGGGTTGNVTLNLNTSYTDSRYLPFTGGVLTGSLSAPGFSGNGSGLTSLNPASLGAGTAGINITGNAATATVAGTAATATNASNAANATNLGGVAAGNYARLDIGNTFTGNQNVTGNVSASGSVAAGSLTIGGGSPITESVSVTQAVTLPAIPPISCRALPSVGLAGFTPGASDTIALGIPETLAAPGGSVFLMYQASETTTSNSPTITIHVCNPAFRPYRGGGTGTIRADIFKH
jgi:uncharacterized repeat protein (TIGR03803 family)